MDLEKENEFMKIIERFKMKWNKINRRLIIKAKQKIHIHFVEDYFFCQLSAK